MPFYVVDRIEGATAVIVADDGSTFDAPRRSLPKGCREGTVLRVDAASMEGPDWANAVIDEPERVRRLERAQKTLRRLSETDPGGDVDL
jgi:DUF3006 family protein